MTRPPVLMTREDADHVLRHMAALTARADRAEADLRRILVVGAQPMPDGVRPKKALRQRGQRLVTIAYRALQGVEEPTA